MYFVRLQSIILTCWFFIQFFLINSALILAVIFSFFPTSKSFAEENPNLTIEVKPLGDGRSDILINAYRVPLVVMLEKLEEKSGVRFRARENLLNETISTEVREVNWSNTVLKIFENFNRLVLWRSETQLEEILLLKHSESNGELLPTNIGKEGGPIQNLEANLSRDQLRMLVRNLLGGSIPSLLFNDKKVRNFFNQHDVKSVDDLRDIKKAMKVRREASKRLRNLYGS